MQSKTIEENIIPHTSSYVCKDNKPPHNYLQALVNSIDKPTWQECGNHTHIHSFCLLSSPAPCQTCGDSLLQAWHNHLTSCQECRPHYTFHSFNNEEGNQIKNTN